MAFSERFKSQAPTLGHHWSRFVLQHHPTRFGRNSNVSGVDDEALNPRGTLLTSTLSIKPMATVIYPRHERDPCIKPHCLLSRTAFDANQTCPSFLTGVFSSVIPLKVYEVNTFYYTFK